MDRMKRITHTNKIDICALMETNANWSKIPQELHPQHSTKGWWECAHWTMMCNRNKINQQEYQLGGAAIAVLNKTAHQATQSGDNKSGLGRWCWVKLKGKERGHISIFVAYQPCISHGPLTNYQQQQ